MGVINKKRPQDPISLRELVASVGPVSWLGLGLLAVASGIFYFTRMNFWRVEAEANETEIVRVATQRMEGNFASAVSDLLILSEAVPVLGYLTHPGAAERSAMELVLLRWCRQKTDYFEMRMVDNKGMELARVNYNHGAPLVVPVDKLHDISKRPYFIRTLALNRQEVFVSPFELNVGDDGGVEQPPHPAILLSTPMFDPEGHKRGVLVFSYEGEKILARLRPEMGASAGQLMLLNADGYWLKGPNPQDEWGFMEERKKDRTFAKSSPAAWARISAAESGRFYDWGGFYAFGTLSPLGAADRYVYEKVMKESSSGSRASPYVWKIVSYVPNIVLLGKKRSTLLQMGLLDVLGLLLLTFFFGLQARMRVHHRRAEEALRHSEERFSKAFRASPAAVSISTLRDGRYVDVNEACTKILGYSREEMIGERAAELVWINPADRGVFVERLKKERVLREMEVKLRTKSGDIRDVILSAELVQLGGETCALIMTQDVTERKRDEETLRQRTVELERSNADLEQFAYVASHDLREPLRMVSSFTQLLAERYKGQLDAQADEFIGFAVEGANRMLTLIDGLLSFSRVQTRAKELQPTDCRAALRRSLANLGVAMREARAEVTCDSLPMVLADESQMEQLFQNLIGNAVKFHGREAPRVHVSATHNGNHWIFSVRDNGIGIDPAHKDRIFALFQRLHSRTEYPGTGIGLSICKKIVERHGGRIWVESAEGRGATFYFTMPLAEEAICA